MFVYVIIRVRHYTHKRAIGKQLLYLCNNTVFILYAKNSNTSENGGDSLLITTVEKKETFWSLYIS